MEDRASRQRLTRVLRGRPDIALALRGDGEGFLYRPRQLVMSSTDAGRTDVTDLFRYLGARRDDIWKKAAKAEPGTRMSSQPPRCEGEGFDRPLEDSLELVVWYFPPNVCVPSVVNHLRSREDARTDSWCGVNHVYIGEQAYNGDPADDPSIAQGPVDLLTTSERAGAGVTVGVLDTGIDEDAAENHAILRGHFDIQPGDVDVLDGPDRNKLLDREAGHGTFVAGVLMQRAPAASFDPQAVLDPNGVGDDVTVSRALEAMLRQGHQIVNMSLGGYVTGDVAPPGLDRALRLLTEYDAVVVAAAGNNSCSQRFLPAADERVLAVAAIDAEGRRAQFSNFGPWVDACAVGVGVTSTFVRGKWDKAHMHKPDNPAPNFTEPFAKWSGTSFAAPRVAGAIAERMATMAQPSARKAAAELLQEAAAGPVGFGKRID